MSVGYLLQKKYNNFLLNQPYMQYKTSTCRCTNHFLKAGYFPFSYIKAIRDFSTETVTGLSPIISPSACTCKEGRGCMLMELHDKVSIASAFNCFLILLKPININNLNRLILLSIVTSKYPSVGLAVEATLNLPRWLAIFDVEISHTL